MSTTYLVEEWHVRKSVMEAVLKILADGLPRTSRQILDILEQQGFSIPKRLVNSILFSEARRYVVFDKKTFNYRLRETEKGEIDQAVLAVSHVEKPDEDSPREIKARYIGRNDEYVFETAQITGPAFFITTAKSKTIEIILNEDHPVYSSLDILINPISPDEQDLYDRLIVSRKSFEILLAAWARYENEQPSGPRRFKVEEARLEWGRNARDLVEDEDKLEIED